jgi:Roadblock/LC7 domain
MDATQALAELIQLSSQVESAVVLDASGALLASTDDADESLGRAALDLLAAAAQLHAAGDEVTRAEVELGEGGLFVLSEGGRTIAATTGPNPTSGLVVYDLRTCLQGIEPEKPKRRRATKKPKEEADE